ncbi:mitogen-activated protein kinase kinase kinase 5-like isoform X1 [Salvia splendens]|uniref:mitogen-activated protein kinase kinase kinase 5-like isoform X1 n=1 Tax=Salvia splendens TaxID=180675 RepID=UPI001C2531AE|nr:mitogen-activated protein kinase kinase kinase 5-like isoform X1 [Salvia splendens]
MHWWQLPFSSSTVAKLRQNDVDANSCSQPLPLPELLPPEPKLLPSASQSHNVPLPSPPDCRSLSLNEETDHHLKSRSSVEQPEFRLSRKSAVKQESRRSIFMSAPTSPVCSPSPSYHRVPPAIFRARSEPRNPHCNGNTGLSCSYQMPLDKISGASAEDPPLITQTVSSHSHVESAPGAGLPEPFKITLDWRESFSHANVHTLPLPPGADMPTPLSSSSSTSHLSGATNFFSPATIPTLVARSEHPGAKQSSPIRSQWQKGKLIGRGTFGSVYVGSNRETGALCAMKEVEILPEDVKSQESIRQLEQEIKVLSKLKHPNIVQYYGSEIVGDKFYIYLEYVHPGSINKFIYDHSAAITESVVRNFTRHILCGLAYLHSTKTIHRDIKGANLLVDAHGVVKLADFGMAKHINGEAVNLSLKGSPYWLAPELLQCVVPSSDIGLAIDIWSLGCTIIQMINGKPPWSGYEGAAALFKVLKESPPIPETLSPEGKDFLQCCFRRNPADRPTASKLLEHPFVDCSRISSTHLN